MALVIAHAELVSDQTSDPRTAPQRRREAVRLGAFQQQRLEAFELRGVQQRLTAGAAGLAQPGFAVTPVSSQPLADALPRDLQSPRCLGLTTALLDQPDRFETALLQGLEIPPYAFCISHTYKDVRTPKRCHFILRDSISTSFGVSHLPIVVDPLKPGTVYAGTVNGVFKSADSGMNWTSTNTGFPASTNVFALAIEPAAAPRKEQDFIWARAMGGRGSPFSWASDVAVDSSGNVYTVGFFEGNADFDPGPGTFNLTTAGDGNITSLGQADIFVSKLDSAGNFIWARAMGGPFADEATGVALDGSGNVYTVGGFRGTADFDPGRLSFNLTNAGGQNSTQLDIFVSKLDTAGNFIWARAMGSRFGEAASDIALDRSGNSYTVGTFEDTIDFDPGPLTYILNAEGDYSIFVSKLDSAGNFGWAGSIGGPFSQDVSGVELDSAGNVYTVGAFQGTGDFDPGPRRLQPDYAGRLRYLRLQDQTSGKPAPD